MQDSFPVNSSLSQARNFEAIVPNDGADLPRRYKAIYVGVAGDISLVGDSSPSGVVHTVAAGAVLICSPVRILDTGTDADNIVGWY